MRLALCYVLYVLHLIQSSQEPFECVLLLSHFTDEETVVPAG